MLRPIQLLIWLYLLPAALAAQSYRTLSFDGDWRFHFGHAADPSRDFDFSVATLFSKTGKTESTPLSTRFDDSRWETIQLPHDWAVSLPFTFKENFDLMAHGYKPVGGLFPETSIGWYRKTFTVPAADSSLRFLVQFDGVFRDAQFWINGFYLGRNESGYIGTTFDLSDYLQFGKPNVLTVRVDASQYEGWFYEGAGIYRHVWLHRLHPLHISPDGIFVQTDGIHNQTSLRLQTNLMNDQFRDAKIQLKHYVCDRTGQVLAKARTTALSIEQRSQASVEASLTLKNPHLWNLEDPYLYRLITVLESDGIPVDSVVTRFGVRQIEISPSLGLLLNEHPIKIQGVNCHQDHAGVGSALPDYLQYYRVRLLKEMGANAYRTSHHPPTPELLDACDSLGLLVLDETRLLNSSPEYLSQMERMVRRDRNHPSVFMWSIGNEEGWVHTTPTGRRIASSMLARLRQLDPTRTATYAADLGNVFDGINEVVPVRSFNYRHQHIQDYHRDHPQQPILGTEMGSTVTTRGIYQLDSARAYVPDQDITAPWWASTAEAWWPLAATNSWMMGGFIWTGFDYRGEPTPFSWPNINSHFGVMDMCGFPKNIYYYYQSWWKNEPVLHVSPHWNWPGKEGQPISVWVNSNAISVELFLNGKSLGEKPMPRNSHLQWEVPYQAGTLEAVGTFRDTTLRYPVRTSYAVARIRATPDKTSLIADGQDAVVVNMDAFDTNGSPCLLADNLLRFQVEGPVRITGVGNGDPSSHEADQCSPLAWQRRLFNGKCQLIIQSKAQPGTVRIRIVSDGLPETDVWLEVK